MLAVKLRSTRIGFGNEGRKKGQFVIKRKMSGGGQREVRVCLPVDNHRTPPIRIGETATTDGLPLNRQVQLFLGDKKAGSHGV